MQETREEEGRGRGPQASGKSKWESEPRPQHISYSIASTKHSMASQQQRLEAWEYHPSDEDPRLEHKFSPNRPIPSDRLEDLGVLNWKIDVDADLQNNPVLEKIKLSRGYKSWDTVTVAPGQLDNYEEKIKQFFQEHLHPYDESRLILDGSGYWDIRGFDSQWIRFRVERGDMIVLPPGMYHRFTLDTNNYIKAMLLFTETPTRIDVMRPFGDDLQVRKDYISSVLRNGPPNNNGINPL
ncbi:hypothetical protein GOP47_0005395 [Adiantum capillus-veneris]|uniref:Acireductone dioxygenase n=1 Tax=Adiantum capillus-veneris TaxID=13818 RepID=A0A9D4ZNI8_ADICA|nr:hypothetical protein GOP47_0005395 [Adiantum capillus-veneris]